MKVIPFDLGLFSEGGECIGESCAAEQPSEVSDLSADTSLSPDAAYGDGTIGDTPEEFDLEALIRSKKERSEIYNYLREMRAARDYEKLYSEALSLASKIEGFDLQKELQNRRFVNMLHAGLSVEEAWRTVHFEELIRAAAEGAAEKANGIALANMRENSSRPDENGVSGLSPVSTSQSADKLTGRGIRDILRRVEKGAKVKF